MAHWKHPTLAAALLGLTFSPVTAAYAADFDSIGRAAFTAPGIAGDALAAGGLLVHLDKFVELRDGTVTADITISNPTSAPAALHATTLGQADRIGLLVQAVDEPVARLTNSQGRNYRLVALSHFGDASRGDGWISVPAGGSTLMTATFAADGAARGMQPFALSFPVRASWRTAVDAPERTGAFEVNFRGLRRATDQAHAAPAPRVDKVAMPLAVPLAIAPAVTPPSESFESTRFNDDLTPQIAKLASATPDRRRYLIAIGVNAYDEAPGVPYADRSAQAMSDLLRKVYGVPEENVTLITGAEATGTKITGRINSLIHRLEKGDTVFFYYAGHGLSARDGSAVYIMPKDAVPGAYEVDALALGALLARFDASPAGRVVAFIDTCFSGRVSRDTSLFPGTAPLVPVPVQATATQANGKVTVFMAGQANQFANDYPERGHRLFSYYMMQGILKGYTAPNDLATFAAREVRRASAKRGSEFVQEPRLEGASLTLPTRLLKTKATAQPPQP